MLLVMILGYDFALAFEGSPVCVIVQRQVSLRVDFLHFFALFVLFVFPPFSSIRFLESGVLFFLIAGELCRRLAQCLISD